MPNAPFAKEAFFLLELCSNFSFLIGKMDCFHRSKLDCKENPPLDNHLQFLCLLQTQGIYALYLLHSEDLSTYDYLLNHMRLRR